MASMDRPSGCFLALSDSAAVLGGRGVAGGGLKNYIPAAATKQDRGEREEKRGMNG